MDSERERMASMRAMAKRPNPAPWIIAGLATLLAFAVGRLTQTEPPALPSRLAPPPVAAPAPEPVPDPAELGALRGCVEELGSRH